jgi:formylglycine-generating enzyme required for sulfatase activity
MKGTTMKMNSTLRLSFLIFVIALMLLATSCKQQTGNGGSTSVTTVRNKMGMELVSVPAGSFMMGSSEEDAQRAFEQAQRENKDARLEWFAPEKPKHQVTIRSGFYMGKYEVTQAQWQAVMGNNPSNFKNCDQCPVEHVAWDDAQEFIKKLNSMNDGYTYRLPSEAEWEYACRAGTTGDYAGDLDSMGWYWENSGDARLSGEWNYDKLAANNDRTHPVGQKQPNAFGLYDMHGNVWEWCEDVWHENYNEVPTDGSAWVSGGEQYRRVARGGAWAFNAGDLRSANRFSLPPDNRDDFVGVRLVAVARSS